jgi:dTDP-4-amino-4,6-dideoxygalactose transaminase
MFLQDRQIGSEIYYPRPMHQQECFESAGPHPSLPVTERLAQECLSLPVFPELTGTELQTVVTAVSAFLEDVNQA